MIDIQSPEFLKLYRESVELMKKRHAWLLSLQANPEKATTEDVKKLVEWNLAISEHHNAMYLEGYCTCFASLRMQLDKRKQDPDLQLEFIKHEGPTEPSL